MKKLTFFLMLGAALFCACNDDLGIYEKVQNPGTEEIPGIDITITTGVEQHSAAEKSSRTTINDKNQLLWTAGDEFGLMTYAGESVTKDWDIVAKITQKSAAIGYNYSASSTGNAPTSPLSIEVKYSDICVLKDGVDITKKIISEGAGNSYGVGIYNSESKYQFASAGTSIAPQMLEAQTTNTGRGKNTTYTLTRPFCLLQCSSSAQDGTYTVKLKGLHYRSKVNNTWSDWTAISTGSIINYYNDKNSIDYETNKTETTQTNESFKTQVANESDGQTSTTFSGTLKYPSATHYGLYPYNESNSIDNEKITFSLPQTQKYAEGTFASGANPCVGKLTGDATKGYALNFKNVCGVLKLQLVGNDVITEIKVKDKAGEALWGTATVPLSEIYAKPDVASTTEYEETPVATFANTSTDASTLVLDCNGGVQLNPTTPTSFYLVVPVGAFTQGFEVTFATYSGEATKETTKANVIHRSVIKAMPQFDSNTMTFTVPEFNIENKTVQYMTANSNTSIADNTSFLTNSQFLSLRSNALANGYRNDRPNEKNISFSSETAKTATVLMATDKSFSNIILEETVTLSNKQGTYTLKNFVPGTTYYYKVLDGTTLLTGGCLKATGLVRMINAGDSWNHRDLGGWTGWNDNKVRYEQIYRGGPTNGMDYLDNKWDATQASLQELHRVGYRAHLDLRGNVSTENPYGGGKWTYGDKKNSYSQGTTNLIEGSFENICTDAALYGIGNNTTLVGDIAFIIKSVLEGKPAYFHCRSGADRTGLVAYTILSLLGCDEYTIGNGCKQTLFDYELTSLSLDEEGTLKWNKDNSLTDIATYSNRSAKDMPTSGYSGFRGLYSLSSTKANLRNNQERVYYYLNRYFADNNLSDYNGNHRESLTIKASDLDRFINYMLGITDLQGNVLPGKTKWSCNYSWKLEGSYTLDDVINHAVADQYKFNYSSI